MTKYDWNNNNLELLITLDVCPVAWTQIQRPSFYMFGLDWKYDLMFIDEKNIVGEFMLMDTVCRDCQS